MVNMLESGAFVYVDHAYKVLSVSVFEVTGAVFDIKFCKPRDFANPPAVRQKLETTHRSRTVVNHVTLPAMYETGAVFFCWILPNEWLAVRPG